MSKDLQEWRDEELGGWLAELGTPEHQLDFFPELRHRLARERRPSTAHARRQRAHRGRLRFAVRVAVVAAVVALIVLLVGLPRDERLPDVVQPSIATAAAIKAEVRAALAQAETLSGIVVSDGPEKGDENRWRFILSANGDFRLTGITLVENIAYDAATGVQRSLNPSASLDGDKLFAAERRGVAPGPPDGGPATWLLPRDFGAVVRALLAADDPRVQETTYDGRPAWRLDIDVAPNAIVSEFSGDRFEITVDRGTGIPVRVVERKDGAFLSEIRIEGLSVDGERGADAFALEFPAGAEVLRSDDGFRRVELGEVAPAVGYPPLVPSFVPEGYELAEVGVAQKAAPTGTEGGNPDSRMVVSLSYRRGLDQFLVTNRLARVPADSGQALPLEERWGDPLATGEGFRDQPETVAIRGGELDGAHAELLIVPRGIPHAWVLTDELVVTVGGDLSREELIRVMGSLAPAYGAN
jgi:hypothetical protein